MQEPIENTNDTPAAHTAAPVTENNSDENGALDAVSTEPVNKDELEAKIIETLKTVYDPEIPVNIYELGLIYEIIIHDDAFVLIKMTLTSPGCPVAGTMPTEIEMKVRRVPGVRKAKVELVWEPTWDMTRMTEAARLQLNLF